MRPREKEASHDSSASEPKPRRSNEFWIAIAGIAATLIVGVIGSGTAYLVAEANNHTQEQFARSQRLATYFAFNQAYQTFFDTALSTLGDFTDLDSTDDPQPRSMAPLADSFNKYSSAALALRFSAPDDVQDAAAAATRAGSQIVELFYPWQSSIDSGVQPGQPAIDELRVEFRKRLQDLATAHDQVIRQLRDVVGLSG